MASLGAFIKLFTEPPSPAEFIDLPTVEGGVNLLALANAERQQQDEQGPSFRAVDPMADYNESQRMGAFNALQNIPNSPLGGAAALIPGAYEGLTRPVEGANPEVPNMLAAVDQMSLGGLIEGNVLGGVMRTKPAGPVGPPARLRGQPTLGGLATADPFYSQVRTVLEDPKTQGTQTGEAWSRFLTDPKRGVKAEEMQYTGLRDLLKAKAGERVTKEEITSHLDANEIEIKEVTKTSEDMLRGNKNQPKFSQYTLPGAENYREVLLTMPEKSPYPWLGKPATAEPNTEGGGGWLVKDDKGQPYAVRYHASAEGAIAESIKRGPTQVAERGRPAGPTPESSPDFTSGHWDEPNVLAHLRLSDRTVGGKRTLLVEEIQSDWAQKGRKEGFAQPDEKLVAKKDEAANGTFWRVETEAGRFVTNVTDPGLTADAAVAEARNRVAQHAEGVTGRVRTGIPSGPFVTDTSKWTALGLKRVLKMAADEGYDSIGIVPGVEQAKRYDLSKQIRTLEYKPGNNYLRAQDHNGNWVIEKTVKPEDLPDVVGKDVAEKLLAAPLGEPNSYSGGSRKQVLEGVDLQVGGEGMKGYYDKIVPETLNKLAKEFGVKVQIEGGKVDTAPQDDTNEALPDEVPIHTLEVPEHMKKAIKSKGFPLYSSLQGKTIGDLANA